MIALPPAAWFATTPACSSRSATCWRYSSIVSSIVEPDVGGRSNAAERVAPRVGLDQDRARPCRGSASRRSTSMPLSPLLSTPDVAEQVRGQLPVRVEAAALLDEADAVEVETRDPARLVRRDLAPDVGERRATGCSRSTSDRRSFAVQSPSASHSLRGRVVGVVDLGRAPRRSSRRRRSSPGRGRGDRGCRRAWPARRACCICWRSARATRSAWSTTCR